MAVLAVGREEGRGARGARGVAVSAVVAANH